MEKNILIDSLTREEIMEVAPYALIVLPIGSIEQHGLHLPLRTDSLIVKEITIKACLQVKDEFPVYMAPVLSYGSSHHHFPYPALSLTSETLIAVLKDLLRSLATIGFKKMMIINSHGGNDEAIRIAARDISIENQVTVAAASYWTMAWNALIKHQALKVGKVPGHAGGFETSLMLQLQPELVHLDRLPPKREDVIPQEENARRIHISRPNNSVGIDGYSDDSRHATKDQGEKFFSIIVREVARNLCDFMREKI